MPSVQERIQRGGVKSSPQSYCSVDCQSRSYELRDADRAVWERDVERIWGKIKDRFPPFWDDLMSELEPYERSRAIWAVVRNYTTREPGERRERHLH